VGRNPKTGVEVQIAPRQVVFFKASNTLRKRLATIEETTD
jgi:nucleoid DNA-binding protein